MQKHINIANVQIGIGNRFVISGTKGEHPLHYYYHEPSGIMFEDKHASTIFDTKESANVELLALKESGCYDHLNLFLEEVTICVHSKEKEYCSREFRPKGAPFPVELTPGENLLSRNVNVRNYRVMG